MIDKPLEGLDGDSFRVVKELKDCPLSKTPRRRKPIEFARIQNSSNVQTQQPSAPTPTPRSVKQTATHSRCLTEVTQETTQTKLFADQLISQRLFNWIALLETEAKLDPAIVLAIYVDMVDTFERCGERIDFGFSREFSQCPPWANHLRLILDDFG